MFGGSADCTMGRQPWITTRLELHFRHSRKRPRIFATITSATFSLLFLFTFWLIREQLEDQLIHWAFWSILIICYNFSLTSRYNERSGPCFFLYVRRWIFLSLSFIIWQWKKISIGSNSNIAWPIRWWRKWQYWFVGIRRGKNMVYLFFLLRQNDVTAPRKLIVDRSRNMADAKVINLLSTWSSCNQTAGRRRDNFSFCRGFRRCLRGMRWHEGGKKCCGCLPFQRTLSRDSLADLVWSEALKMRNRSTGRIDSTTLLRRCNTEWGRAGRHGWT